VLTDRSSRLVVRFGLTAALLVGLAGPGSFPAAAQVPPADNPAIEEKCGVDLTLVLDASGSVQQAGAVNQVRGAAQAFLDALSNTGSTARVTQFGTVAQELAPSTLVDDRSLGAGGCCAARSPATTTRARRGRRGSTSGSSAAKAAARSP
jgi:hypothetical protein